MIEKVLNYVQEQHMLAEGDCVIAGVSGGADSVCLLFMLLELKKSIPIEIQVVHVNHMIRSEAAEDAAYVEKLCALYKLPFTLIKIDVESLAASCHISMEEAGRKVRYAAFEEALGTRQGKIAIAHNKNDCCETFLFHLFRGSSLKGLSGIRPVRDKIIRPLMCLERSEIEAFLQERNIHYCIDRTNLEDNYTRNKIRHHILETAQEISAAAVKHISSACERVSEAYDLIEDMTQQAYESCVSLTADAHDCAVYHIEKEQFAMLHHTIQGYLVMEVLSRAAGSRKDLEAVHIRQVQELFGKQCGRAVNLPYGMYAERVYTGICIYKRQEAAPAECMEQEIVLSAVEKERLLAGEILTIPLNEQKDIILKVELKFVNAINLKNIPEKKYTKLLDYDKIKNSIVIRTRRAGDYLTINSINQRKSLKAYFIDNKVPKEDRSKVYLVTEGSHVMWVIGGRISSYYKIDEKTERILCLAIDETAVNKLRRI